MDYRARVSFPRLVARIRRFTFADILGFWSATGQSSVSIEGRVDPAGRLFTAGTSIVAMLGLVTRLGRVSLQSGGTVVMAGLRTIGMRMNLTSTSQTSFSGQITRGGAFTTDGAATTSFPLALVIRQDRLEINGSGLSEFDSRVLTAFHFATGAPVGLAAGGNLSVYK